MLTDTLRGLTSPAIVAIIRLETSRRSWFVTGVVAGAEGLEVVGYSPGGHHSSGGWFQLPLGWFESAAAAIEDRVSVELLNPPVGLEDLVDESL